MNEQQRAAMQAALEEMTKLTGWTERTNKVCVDLRAALAQQDQPTPAAWIDGSGHPRHISYVQSATERRLYGPLSPLYEGALQQEQGEPVATLHDDGCFTWKNNEFRRKYDRHRAGWRMDVYAAPPQRKPLTDEQIDRIAGYGKIKATDNVHRTFARAIERAHGIGDEHE
jgi:hypothetical protein